MIMKKMWLLLLLLVGVLTGCGGKKEDEVVTIKYALWDSTQAPVYRELADEFEKQNPNIKVEIELTPFQQYWTKLEAATTGGQMPDVIWMSAANFEKYAINGMLLPLDENIKNAGIDMNKYVEGTTKLYQMDGQQYGMPKDVDSIAMWYNKELFDKAGVEYPTDEWTWEDMKKAAIKIQSTLDGVYGVVLPLNDAQASYYNVIPQNEGFVISEDKKTSGYGDPNTIEAISMIKDLMDSGASPDYTTVVENKANEMFQSGQVAMLYDGAWRAVEFNHNEELNKKVGVVTMPKIKNKSTVVHGLGLVIGKTTKHPEEAWKLIEFLSTKEAHEKVGKSGIVIPAYIETQSLWAESYKTIDVSAYVDALKENVPYPASLDTSKWAQIEVDELTKVWTGQATPEEACKTIETEMNAILAKEKK
jgi:multiple sugar transport system substrate-binding protein